MRLIWLYSPAEVEPEASSAPRRTAWRDRGPGDSRAGALAGAGAVIVAALFFGAGAELLAYTQVKAILLSLDVLYIIWTALLLFHIADEAGAVTLVGRVLPSLTADRTMQGLLLGWLFASFLQGMGGFGVPVAVAAPLLVGLGFTPVQAVMMACIGHGWAVNFGSLATSFQTLLAVTGLPASYLAADASVLLGISSVFCGAIVALIAGGWRGMLRTLPVVLVLSAVMGVTQHLLVTNDLYTLGATGGAMAGLLAGVALCRILAYRGQVTGKPSMVLEDGKPRSLVVVLSAYILLVVLAFAINLIPALTVFFDQVQLTLSFPALTTDYGFSTPAELGRKINLFGHPGAILIYAALLATLIYHRMGYFKPYAARRIFTKVTRGAVNSSLGVVAMVGMAVVMSHSGMTNLLAEGLSKSFGKVAYPFISPFLGALGAFITGSNNNSNVLFGILQQRTAEMLGLSVSLMLAAQTTGGSLGSVLAPAKVIVGCSTVGLGDNEGVVMGKILLYGIVPIALTALAAGLWMLSG